MKTKLQRHFAISLIFGLLFSFSISAQNNWPIEGPIELCASECGTYTLMDSTTASCEIYMWNGEIVQLTPFEPVDICWDQYGISTPGTYYFEVLCTDFAGQIYFVEFLIFIYGGDLIFIDSNVDDVCPNGNNSSSNCEKVCAGSTLTYTIENIPNGQISWEVIGAESWENNYESITVNWGAPGQGQVNVTVYDAFCESFESICVEILEDPEASFTSIPEAENGIIRVCKGQTVFFSNTSEGASTFLWNSGNGSNAEETNVAFTYASSGIYEVSLIAYNECFCTDTTIVKVEVQDAISPFVDCVSTICEGETVTYTSDASCGTFNWIVNGSGTIIDGGDNDDNFITIEWTGGPEGFIELTVDDCGDPNICLEPNIIQIPILSDHAVIEGPAQVCRASVANYSIPPYEGTSFTWAVSTYGTIISGQGSNEITVDWFAGFIPNITQTVSVVYENCYLECGGDALLNVEVQAGFFVEGPIEVCENATETFNTINDFSNIGVNSNWEVLAPDGSSVWTSGSSSSSAAIDWTFGPGVYTLIATPTNATTICVDNDELTITIIAAPDPATTITGETNICPNTSYTYEAISTAPQNNFKWHINNGGMVSEVLGNPINVTWGVAGPYELSVSQISTNGLACESEPTSINIDQISGSTITGDQEVCQEQTSSYSATYYEGVEYNWTISPDGIGTIISDPTTSAIEVLWHTDGPVNLGLNVCGEIINYPITIYPRPQVVVNHSTSLCPNETDAVSTSIPFMNYMWKDEFGAVVSNAASPDLGPGYYQVVVENEFGCLGDTTFYINGHPPSEISISTPDNEGFCPNDGDGPRTLYAVNAQAGYSYQWYHNGAQVGTNSPTYITIDFGSYWVIITDSNGCMFQSNNLVLFEYCEGSGGVCNGQTCSIVTDCEPSTLVQFTFENNGTCNYVNFDAVLSGNTDINSLEWTFDDPNSNDNTTIGTTNTSHKFSKAGFYKVVLTANVENPDSLGTHFICYDAQVVAVPLAASFDFDKACAGSPVSFLDLSTFLPNTSIVSWSWSFGDPASGGANTSTDINPTHTFDTDGTYVVALTVTDQSGCTSSIAKTVEIYSPPAVSFDEPIILCEATALNYIADVPVSVTYAKWDFGDPSSGDANNSELFDTYHAFDAPGNYTVILTVQSIYGCTNSFSRVITVEPNTLNGDITFSQSSPICEGDNTTLTAPSGGISWEWSTGEITNSIVVDTAGIYEVTITDTEGCTYTPAGAQLDIIPAPDASIRAVEFNDYNLPTAFYYDDYETCFGEDLFLSVSENTNYTYEWSNGDEGTETAFSEARGNLLGVGDHNIFLDVTDQTTACSNTVGPFTITVHPLPDPVTIEASVTGLICESTATTFTVMSTQAGVTYIWSNGETGTSMTTAEAGTYRVTAVNEFGCEMESNELEIIAGPDISKIPSGCHSRCSPDTLCLPSIPGVVSYQWYLDGVAIPSPEGTIPNLIATESGSYTVEMTSSQGCILTSDVLSLDLFPGFGTVQGLVYFDVNENGIIDGPDTLMNNIPIHLTNGTVVLSSTSSNHGGSYAFPDIPTDDYTLVVDTMNLPDSLIAINPTVDALIEGCDDEEIINWLIQIYCPSSTDSLSFDACAGTSIEFDGQMISAGSDMTFDYTNINGCDSTVIVSVIELETSISNLILSVCPGETVEYESTTLAAGDQMDFTFVNAVGCDSTISVQVDEAMSDQIFVELDVCDGETTEYNGNTLQAGDQMDFFFTNEAGCDSVVSVSVDAMPLIEFDVTTLESCPNTASGNISIQPLSTDYTYSIDAVSFQNEPNFENLQAGTYTLQVQDPNGCMVEESIDVLSLPSLQYVVEDIIISCEDLEAELKVQVFSADMNTLSVLWDDGSTDLNRTIRQAGAYSVIVSDGCQSMETTVQARMEDDPNRNYMYIPNAFSPNGDGFNDEFHGFIPTTVGVQDYKLHIFDRWGNQVFLSEDPTQGWDGKFKGNLLSTGVFIWHMEATVLSCGQEVKVERKGDIVLMR